MKNILKYLVNTILFIVISFIPATLFILWSFSINGYRPSGLIAIGGIISLFISYTIVKRINENSIYNVHVDTRISALEEMYSIYNDNNNCQFTTKNGPDGGQVLSNKEIYIDGLYIYLS